jgi:integrase
LSAAIKYIEAGGEARYLSPLMKYFGETPLTEIDQDAIDEAAKALRPNTTGATKNRCVYTPASSVLRHAKINIDLTRPIDAKAKRITDALTPEDAAGIIEAAKAIDPEYGLLLTFLLYTGCRLSEALNLRWDDVQLSQGTAYVRESKNGDPRSVRLRSDLAAALMKHTRHESGRVFRLRPGGHLKYQLVRAKFAYLGLPCPRRRPVGWKPPVYRLAWVNHHTFRHTWATWMRRYGGLDLTGLKATGQWRDERSAARYAHAVPREEWSRVETLPDVNDPEWKTRGMEKIA